MEDCAQHLGHCMVDMRELSATPEGLTAAGELTMLILRMRLPSLSPFTLSLLRQHSAWQLSASRCISLQLFISFFFLALVVSVRVSEGLFRKAGGGRAGGGKTIWVAGETAA